VATPQNAATIANGSLGIFHGMKSYHLPGRIGTDRTRLFHFRGLNYPGIGPEHAHLHDTNRAQYVRLLTTKPSMR
jgi:tryptophan synthase beta chain